MWMELIYGVPLMDHTSGLTGGRATWGQGLTNAALTS